MATSSVKVETVKHNGVVRVKQRKQKQEMTGSSCHRYEQTLSEVAPERNSSGSASTKPKEGLADTKSRSAPKSKSSTECQLVEDKKIDTKNEHLPEKTSSKDEIIVAAASNDILSRMQGDGSTPSQRTSDKGELNHQTEEVLRSMTGLIISDKGNEPATNSSVERKGATETLEIQLQKLSLDEPPQLLERGKSRRTSDNNKEARQPKPYRQPDGQSLHRNVEPSSATVGVATGDFDDEFLHSVAYETTVRGMPADYPTGNTTNDLNNLNNYPDSVTQMSTVASNSGQLQNPNANYMSIPPNITMDSGQQQFGQVLGAAQGQAMVWNSHQNDPALAPLGVQSVLPSYAVSSVPQYTASVSPVQSNPMQQAVASDQICYQTAYLPPTTADPTHTIAYVPLLNQIIYGINNNHQPQAMSSSTYASPATSPPIVNTGHCGIANNRTDNYDVCAIPLTNNQNHSSEQQAQPVRHDSGNGNIPNIVPEEIVDDDPVKTKGKKKAKGGNKERKPSNKKSTVKKEKKTKSPKTSPDPIDSSLSSASGDGMHGVHPNMSAVSNSDMSLAVAENSVQSLASPNDTEDAYQDAMCLVAEDFRSMKSPQVTSSPENVVQELLQNPDLVDDLVRLAGASSPLTDNQVTSWLSDVTQQHQNSPATALPTTNAVPPTTMVPQPTTVDMQQMSLVAQQQQLSHQYQYAALDADLILQQPSVPVFNPQQTAHPNFGQATQFIPRGQHAPVSTTRALSNGTDHYTAVSPVPINQQIPYSATPQDMVQPQQMHMDPQGAYHASLDQSTPMFQAPHVQGGHQTAYIPQYSASATATASVQMNGYPRMTQRSMPAHTLSTEPGTMTVSVTSQTTVQTEPTQSEPWAPNNGVKRDSQCFPNLGLYNSITKAGLTGGKPVNTPSIDSIMNSFVRIRPKETQ